MRLVIAILIALGLSACATVDFQRYEGKDNLYEGQGGTKVIVDGIDFWANGSPPRKYSIVGVATSEIGAGVGDESLIRSAIAAEVKKQGGNAAVQVTNNATFAGVVRAAPGFYMAANVRRMQFAVIRYMQ